MDSFYNGEQVVSPVGSEAEEDIWWSTQVFTLLAGLGCGMVFHLIIKSFSGQAAPARFEFLFPPTDFFPIPHNVEPGSDPMSVS